MDIYLLQGSVEDEIIYCAFGINNGKYFEW